MYHICKACNLHSQDAIEYPFLGIPGIVRFIDVRTQWFDEGVTTAMDDGITQVRLPAWVA
jgi:hypothetical protein